MAKTCNCESCQMSKRIQAEWEHMSLATQAIVDDMFGKLMCEATDAEYWKMRAHNQWPDHHEHDSTPDGLLRPLQETSAEAKTEEVG